MKLYIYDHCPFSMRPRLIAGIKNITIDIEIVRVADLETVPNMIGKNIRPVLEKDDGTYMAESMDLAIYLDQLSNPIITNTTISPFFEDVKSKILKDYVALTAPLFMKTCREFQVQADHDRYQQREEAFLEMTFTEIEMNKQDIIRRMTDYVAEFEQFIESDLSKQITATEIALFPFMAHLDNFKLVQLPNNLKLFVDQLRSQSFHELLPKFN